MLCQHCHKNEAELHFSLTNGYQAGEVHLCSECAEQLGKQYMQYMQQMQQLPFGWQMTSSQSAPLNFGYAYSPTEADSAQLDEDFAYRRKLSELRARLQHAVDKEDYESAAKIRDEIKLEKKSAETKTKRIRDVSLN